MTDAMKQNKELKKIARRLQWQDTPEERRVYWIEMARAVQEEMRREAAERFRLEMEVMMQSSGLLVQSFKKAVED